MGELWILINLLCSFVVIFLQRKEPRSAWAWLLVLNALPGVGFLLYLLAGTDMNKRRMFRIKEIEDQVNEAVRRQECDIRRYRTEAGSSGEHRFADQVYYNLETTGAMLFDDNETEIFTDGNEKFESLIRDIRGAQHFIFLQYYIIRSDLLFDRIREELIQKQQEGVEVRVLFDGMGCRSVSRRYWKEMEKCGIRTAVFFPALLGRLHIRVNYRNHRKIAVIDGKIGYVGGFNIGKEYLGLDPDFGYWRDTHLRIRGKAVAGLLIRYMQDWDYAARENLFADPGYLSLTEEAGGDVKMQIISSGPDSARQVIRDNYLMLINKARRRIFIQTPYFIPDEALMAALLIAVSSGVEVNVMIPCKPDHPFVYWATWSYVGELVNAGANCYTYDNGFIHAKGVLVDGEACCYGTANFDNRSFALNFEVNAVIYDGRIAKQMEQIFLEDVKKSCRITKEQYAARSLWIRFKEQCCRLLSPLL